MGWSAKPLISTDGLPDGRGPLNSPDQVLNFSKGWVVARGLLGIAHPRKCILNVSPPPEIDMAFEFIFRG
jgi:hypothetical protein